MSDPWIGKTVKIPAGSHLRYEKMSNKVRMLPVDSIGLVVEQIVKEKWHEKLWLVVEVTGFGFTTSYHEEMDPADEQIFIDRMEARSRNDGSDSRDISLG